MQYRWAFMIVILKILIANYHSESLLILSADRVTTDLPSERAGSFKPEQNSKLKYLNQRSRRELLNAKGLPKKFTWRETWAFHYENVKLVHWDGNARVAIYFDYDIEPRSSWKYSKYTGRYTYEGPAKWLFEFTTNVWAYVRQTYGDIGLDTYLYLVIHPLKQGYKGINYRFSNDPKNRLDDLNLIDITFPQPNAWLTNQTRAEEMDLLLKIIAYYVEYSSKDRYGSPSAPVWNGPSYGDTAWVDIFTYDVYTSLNMTADAQRAKNKYTVKAENSPREFSFWFRDWFLSIYENYGGRSVLNEYYNLLGRFVPNFTTGDLIHVYSYNLDMGSFVHFWSGAARTDLRANASRAFGWNTTYEEQFFKARKGFPALTELYHVVDGSTSTTGIPLWTDVPLKSATFLTSSNTSLPIKPYYDEGQQSRSTENPVTPIWHRSSPKITTIQNDIKSTIQISNASNSNKKTEPELKPLVTAYVTEITTATGLSLKMSSSTSSSYEKYNFTPNPDNLTTADNGNFSISINETAVKFNSTSSNYNNFNSTPNPVYPITIAIAATTIPDVNNSRHEGEKHEVTKYYGKSTKLATALTKTPGLVKQSTLGTSKSRWTLSWSPDLKPGTNATTAMTNENANFITTSRTSVTLTEPQSVFDKSAVITGASMGASVIFILIVALVSILIFHSRKIQNLQTEIRALTNEEVKEFFEGDTSLDLDEAQALVLSMPFIKDFEIPREQFILDPTRILGSGQFGTVFHGFIRFKGNKELTPAAMKTVKSNVDVVSFKTFLSEVKIMAYLGKHENIVGLLGTCTENIKNREIFIAMEFCPLGNLLDFLKKNRSSFEITTVFSSSLSTLVLPFTTNSNRNSARSSYNAQKLTILSLLTWSQEISNAMVYLTSKKVIHGDLAARNILLTENRIARISDFGLSRQFLNYANYMKTSRTPVPWRWLAVECIKEMKFSPASDVWAFGVTLWEIFSLGEVPYGAWTFDLFFADKLINGDRLLIPKHANQRLYDLMKNCWKLEPGQRPTFQDIQKNLSEMITDFSPPPIINEDKAGSAKHDLATTDTVKGTCRYSQSQSCVVLEV